MGFSDFATRFGVMMVLRLPRGYELLTPQWRYMLLYRMRRPHERDFRALPLLKFSNQPLLVDVGGNIGQSVLSLYTVFPAATVVSFEPNPTVFHKLQRLTKKFPRLTRHSQRTFRPNWRGGIVRPLVQRQHTHWTGILRLRERQELAQPRPCVAVRSDEAHRARPSGCLLFVSMTADCSRISSRSTSKGWNTGFLREGWQTIRTYRPVIMAETIRSRKRRP